MNLAWSRSKTENETLLNIIKFHRRCCGSQKCKETLERGNGASRLLSIMV